MKNIKLLALLGVVLFSCTLAGCGKDKNNEGDFIIEDITSQNDAVINYNDTLVDLTSQCISTEDKIWSTYDSNNSTTNDVISAIDNLINECSKAGEEINKLGGWEGDNSLKDGVIAVIEKEMGYYAKFSELLPYLEKENLTEEENASYTSIYSEIEALEKELDNANKKLSIIQEEFSEKYGFELEEETTGEITEETAE